jgi:Fe2+ or Zn2+ uptake regulation protein
MDILEKTLIRLMQSGHRMTSVRREILVVLAEADAPLTKTAITEALAARGLRPDRTTIYREMNFLVEADAVETVELGAGDMRYELHDGFHHHHLVCTNCDRITCYPLQNELEGLEQEIGKLADFKVTGHTLEFFGLCGHCR